MKHLFLLSALLLLLIPAFSHAQRATIASEKDYMSGDQVEYILVQVDDLGINRVLTAMKGRDGDFENLRETTSWVGFKLPNLVGALDIQVTQGVYSTSKGEGKFTPVLKQRALKEGESYALKVTAQDNEGNNVMEDADKRDSLMEYLEGIAKR